MFKGLERPCLSALVVKKNEGGMIKSDRTECYKFIKIFINQINQFFGVTWQDIQLSLSSEIFYEKYFCWRDIDMKLFAKKSVSLELTKDGTMYGQFTPAMLMEWAEKFEEQRLECVIQHSENNHSINKKDPWREHVLFLEDMNKKYEADGKRKRERALENEIRRLKAE